MIEIDTRAMSAFAQEDRDGPVVMLNLLRFRPDGGRERYLRYAERLAQGINERYGIQIVYLGDGGPALVAESGQEWDTVVLVRYPSRQAFVDMIRDPDYQAGAHLRSEALIESVLQPTAPLAC
jgi:uncharacterized protein (DUF1330 family)